MITQFIHRQSFLSAHNLFSITQPLSSFLPSTRRRSKSEVANTTFNTHTRINNMEDRDSSEPSVTATTENGSSTSTTTTILQDPSSVLPLRMTSVVVQGYGRGSKDLGIPTANLDRDAGQFSSTESFDDLPTGIYWGFCRIGTKEDHIYKTACSIGYNPYYGNNRKTVEPHLIADPTDNRRHQSSCGESLLGDFYNQPIRLSLVGYLRPELPFEGLEKLIEAIKQDIATAEELGEGEAASIQSEKAWITSEDPPTIRL